MKPTYPTTMIQRIEIDPAILMKSQVGAQRVKTIFKNMLQIHGVVARNAFKIFGWRKSGLYTSIGHDGVGGLKHIYEIEWQLGWWSEFVYSEAT